MDYGKFYYLVIDSAFKLDVGKTYTADVNNRKTSVLVTALKTLLDNPAGDFIAEMRIETSTSRLTCVGICRIVQKFGHGLNEFFIAGIFKPGTLQINQATMMDLVRENHAYWDPALIYELARA